MMKKVIAWGLLAVAASSCSWHLRGSVGLPQQLSQIYISAQDSKGALMTELRQTLKASHIAVLEDSSSANYSLSILNETKDKRTAGVGGDALSSAYEITLKVDYEIQLKNSPEITKATASSVRSFNYNTATINSATQEEALLEQEMRRDLVQQMLRRLTAVAANPPAKHDAKHGQTAP